MVTYKGGGTGTMRRKTRHLVSMIPSMRSLSRKNCPPGEVLRKGYLRHYSTAIRREGYIRKRPTGSVYRIFPKGKNMYVESRCVKNTTSSKSKSKMLIGPLRKGELAKYGYSFRVSDAQRHAALHKAVEEYSSLGVYRKLDAVAKLTKQTIPRASKVFEKDRKWINETFGPLKVA